MDEGRRSVVKALASVPLGPLDSLLKFFSGNAATSTKIIHTNIARAASFGSTELESLYRLAVVAKASLNTSGAIHHRLIDHHFKSDDWRKALRIDSAAFPDDCLKLAAIKPTKEQLHEALTQLPKNNDYDPSDFLEQHKESFINFLYNLIKDPEVAFAEELNIMLPSLKQGMEQIAKAICGLFSCNNMQARCLNINNVLVLEFEIEAPGTDARFSSYVIKTLENDFSAKVYSANNGKLILRSLDSIDLRKPGLEQVQAFNKSNELCGNLFSQQPIIAERLANLKEDAKTYAENVNRLKSKTFVHKRKSNGLSLISTFSPDSGYASRITTLTYAKALSLPGNKSNIER